MTDDLLARERMLADAWAKAADKVTAQAEEIATQDRCLRYCYEKLQPLVSFEDWLKQWEGK